MRQQSGQSSALAPGTSVEHPCAGPFAFTLAIPSGISLTHKGSVSPEQRPKRSEVVTAPLPQRHLPAEEPESPAQRLDGEGEGEHAVTILVSPQPAAAGVGSLLSRQARQK